MQNQFDGSPADEWEDEGPSKTQLKRDSEALQELGEELVNLKPTELVKVPPESIGVGLYQTVTSMMNSGDWAGMFASVVIVFVPTVVIYAFLSDKIISGVTAGGNKG